MDTLKERQLTIRASRRPIEYNYTNADVHHADTTESSGYQFEYPVSWTGDQSTQKVIGVRRINYKPTSVNIAFYVTVAQQDIPCVFVFTDQNTFEECIQVIKDTINAALEEAESTVRCGTQYDKDLGTFRMFFDTALSSQLPFTITFGFGKDKDYDPDDATKNSGEYVYYKSEFLKLFNQQVTNEAIKSVYEYWINIKEIKFTNVWNRDNFYCHSSFSDSPRRIIGINKDFWPTPSVFYDYSDNSNDFHLWFTTDTVHRILPRNGVMLIQLSYIFNYATSMLQYT